MASDAAPITDHERAQVDRANASGLQPVAFVHGLWLLPSSWDRWAAHFEAAGYIALTPAWPGDAETVQEANAHPEHIAGVGITEIADHVEAVLSGLDRKPAIMGHSFGGLLTQILAGRGASAASVAIDPAPFRGVLPLPISTLRASSPVLGNPANRGRGVPLTFEQFQYGFANTVDEAEARTLYESYAVPAPGRPLFQAATANFNPWTEAKVDHENPDRGPLLIISGEKDHVVPPVVAQAEYRRQARNPGVTELVQIDGASHGLTIDSGWQAVADTALAFIRRFV